MIFYSLMANSKQTCDLLVTHPAHHAGQNLHLAIRKWMERRAGFTVRASRSIHLFIDPVIQLAASKYVTRHRILAIIDRPHGARQSIGFDLFGTVSYRASQHSMDRLFDIIVTGQKHHTSRQVLGSDLMRHLLTV